MNDNRQKNEGYVPNEGKSDYKTDISKRFKIVAYVLSLFAAVVLWAYVSLTFEEAQGQFVFNAPTVTFIGESSLMEEYGLVVQSVDDSDLSLTVTGAASLLAELNSSDVTLSVDLSSISMAGQYECTIDATIPDGLKYSLSRSTVTISVDKPETKVINVDRSDIQLMGVVRESGCTIVDSYLNITKVTLEGNTMNLAKVAGVQIRTGVIGVINSGTTVPAQIYLLDENGNDLSLPINVTTDAGKEGITVSLTVYREKLVDLTYTTAGGYSSTEIVISPSQVKIYGDASVVNKIDSIALDLEPVDESTLLTDVVYENVGIAATEGLEITAADGSVFEGATVEVKVSSADAQIIEVTDFVALNMPENMVIADGFILLTVRAYKNDSDTAVTVLESLAQNPDRIMITADYQEVDDNGEVAVTVTLPDDCRSYVYVVGTYTVTFRQVE